MTEAELRARTSPPFIPPAQEQERRWLLWLYETHSREELARWARQMRFFRFCRAQGGHANDGDRLMLNFHAPTEADVLRLFDHFGWKPVRYPPDTPQMQPGVAYRYDEYSRFPSLIREYPTLGQPGQQQLCGQPVSAHVGNGYFGLELRNPDSVWEVDQRAVDTAVAIEEQLIQPLVPLILEPPYNDRHCLCPKFYPDLFL